MAFGSCVVPDNWRSAAIVPLYKGKGERTECKSYRGIRLLSVLENIYAGILINRVRRVTGGLIEDKQGGFRAGKLCVNQISILKQIGERVREKKRRM